MRVYRTVPRDPLPHKSLRCNRFPLTLPGSYARGRSGSCVKQGTNGKTWWHRASVFCNFFPVSYIVGMVWHANCSLPPTSLQTSRSPPWCAVAIGVSSGWFTPCRGGVPAGGQGTESRQVLLPPRAPHGKTDESLSSSQLEGNTPNVLPKKKIKQKTTTHPTFPGVCLIWLMHPHQSIRNAGERQTHQPHVLGIRI